jgi:hypothetical protein
MPDEREFSLLGAVKKKRRGKLLVLGGYPHRRGSPVKSKSLIQKKPAMEWSPWRGCHGIAGMVMRIDTVNGEK